MEGMVRCVTSIDYHSHRKRAYCLEVTELLYTIAETFSQNPKEDRSELYVLENSEKIDFLFERANAQSSTCLLF